MKILAKIKSNRGHKKEDFLVTLSDIEISAIKKLINGNKDFNPKHFLGDGSKEYNAIKGIKILLIKK